MSLMERLLAYRGAVVHVDHSHRAVETGARVKAAVAAVVASRQPMPSAPRRTDPPPDPTWPEAGRAEYEQLVFRIGKEDAYLRYKAQPYKSTLLKALEDRLARSDYLNNPSTDREKLETLGSTRLEEAARLKEHWKDQLETLRLTGNVQEAMAQEVRLYEFERPYLHLVYDVEWQALV